MVDLGKLARGLGFEATSSAAEPVPAAGDEARPGRFQVLLAAAVGAVLVLFVVAGVRAYGDLADARARQAELELEVEASDARTAALVERVERLRNDEATLERIAREELGMVFPDEAIVFLPAEPAAIDR